MVTIFIIYLLKVCGAVALFTLAYTLLLRQDSHLMARRWFLMAAILTSFIFQAIPSPLPATIATAELTETMEATTSIETSDSVIPIDRGIELTHILFMIWAVGATILLLRVIYAFAMIIAIRLRATHKREFGIDYLLYDYATTPFSLFGWIFLSARDEGNEEILLHERAHKDGWHSLDILLMEITTVIMWFNPFAWILSREVHDNLEFIADHNVIEAGVDKRVYQHKLLHHCTKDKNIVATYFNQSQIKNRITMMNKKRKSSWAVVRYATLPMLVIALAMTNAPATTVESTQGDEVKIVEGGATQTRSSSEILDKLSSQTNPTDATPLIIMDDKEITKEQFEALDYDKIARVSILKDDAAVKTYGEKGKNGVIIVGSKK